MVGGSLEFCILRPPEAKEQFRLELSSQFSYLPEGTISSFSSELLASPRLAALVPERLPLLPLLGIASRFDALCPTKSRLVFLRRPPIALTANERMLPNTNKRHTDG